MNKRAGAERAEDFGGTAGLLSRVLITVFMLPFFAVGLSMCVGGSLFIGQTRGISLLGSVFGLAFLALPLLALINVWSGKRPPSRPAAVPNADEQAPPEPASAARACAYCGRLRPLGPGVCDGCGAR
ncbi:MAG: hypothetical protein IBJ11_04445 [Phycisphaerales bacterium]|nr:hypothetical protein [Phycisphaerales bacterium]